MKDNKINILLVDDQPAKLLSYEVILRGLDENLIQANSAREAMEHLLKHDIAVVLVDVCMPELDGFQLAALIRDHPRFQKTAIIFISAIQIADVDTLRGYELGAVDYVPVPVVPEVLRAKVRVFAELYRKTRELEKLNRELEMRVADRTAELQASTARLLQSEQLRSLALAAGQMGSWDWDISSHEIIWDEGQYRIFGVDPKTFRVNTDNIRALIHPDDWLRMEQARRRIAKNGQAYQMEYRVRRPNGELRWCIGTVVTSLDEDGKVVRLSGVTVDITERKEAEERRAMLAREVDHRARNALAVVQSIVRLTRAKSVDDYMSALEGRIGALSRAHILLSKSRWEGADLGRLVEEEMAPYRVEEGERILINGPPVVLQPATAQTLALALHELATNAAKYGALSAITGRVSVTWQVLDGVLSLEWVETGGPHTVKPSIQGYGTRVIAASIERQLGGRAVFDWRPQGLNFNLSVPQGEEVEDEDGAAITRDTVRDTVKERVKTANGVAKRILLVEDEAIVAMMMADMLGDLRFAVLGPINRLAPATAAARDDDIDAAILDVNLAGENVYPVAEILESRGVPFVFVTGYGIESIDRRFAHVPVIQKPVERPALESLFAGVLDGSMKRAAKRGKTAEKSRAAALAGSSESVA
jgi:PAS domain S-box-containing protein